MKDSQIAAKSSEPRIFLVSPLLHCVSMTVLVYLRSSFGFGYLRPKSTFLALSWAFILYGVYAWVDGRAWGEQRSVILFGVGAVVLYWTHLAIAFTGSGTKPVNTNIIPARRTRFGSFNAMGMHRPIHPKKPRVFGLSRERLC